MKNKIEYIIVNDNERIDCDVLVLAIGHSARDTFKMLYDKGIVMQNKPFAVGVRVEHSQDMINESQYGEKYKNMSFNLSLFTGLASNNPLIKSRHSLEMFLFLSNTKSWIFILTIIW